jgi:hypothetical protein
MTFANDNAMLFLIGATPKQEFIQGLSAAASTTRGGVYSPIADNAKPTTPKPGAAFPVTTWIAFPPGNG